MSYNAKNYTEQGGARTVIGGEIDIVTGGALKIAGVAVTKTAAQLNELPIVEQTAVGDIAADAVDAAQNTKINAILAALRAANIIADA